MIDLLLKGTLRGYAEPKIPMEAIRNLTGATRSLVTLGPNGTI
jgi:hypothetical protein